MATDWEAKGLLEGVDGQAARAARRDLLDRLSSEGVPDEELEAATREGRLALLPVELLLEEERRYTQREVAEKAGIELDLVQKVWRALGMPRPDPEEAAFGEQDLAAVRGIRYALDAGMPPSGVLEIARVMSQGMAALAATVSRNFGEAFLRPGDTELDVALRYTEATRELGPMLGPLLQHVLRLQQIQQVRQNAVGGADLEAGSLAGSEDVTVCFADLVGFTKLGEELPADELGVVAGRLTELATEVAAPPVRLVKTIGDAAMLVSSHPDPLLGAALELVEAADREAEGFPQLRAGVAYGPALPRGGDWYGRPVNLASRITSFARPGSVVAAEPVREAVDGAYAWSFAGKRKFKGISGETAVFRVRRAAEEVS